jgi:LysR family carnitine catabolism transcriptional activator
MVRHGLGISILPSSVRQVMNMDGLVCRLIEGPLAVRRLGTIVRRGHRLSPAAAGFADLLKGEAAKTMD